MDRSDLSQADQALLPTPEDAAEYQRRGWYVSGRLFSDDELDRVVEATEAFYSGLRDRTLPKSLPPSAYWTPDHGDILRHNDYICYENDDVFRILCKPLLGAIAARLMRTSLVRLWSSTLISKPARPDEPTNIVPWHIDKHHWQSCTSDELITAFVPLHDCLEDSGTLTVLDGSHRWAEMPADESDDSSLHFAQRPVGAMDRTVHETARFNDASVEPVALPLRRGQVSFHHCRTYHGSAANLSDNPRRVVTVRFQDRDNVWRDFRKPNGDTVTYSHDLFVRRNPEGRPDYSDEMFCPVVGGSTPGLWRRHQVERRAPPSTGITDPVT